ncbi:hypothetical protein NQ314_004856 [Rhamnusium bicolor]|uniref:Uncharacterized protein n=1 Tax=Rhamnusium bicolor TaxID=1586634 RepID=A0AAV8ZK91_9CUCU|nr:hypothetical protein NQ314_004856 [Rhamnusium bicolor]
MSDDVKIITCFDKLCRTCLSEKDTEELRSLFENSLETQFTEITSIKVEHNDGLPNNICNDCYFTLNVALNFKDQCQKSESQLRSALCPGQTIIYRSITILGNNSEELQIENFEEIESDLPVLKDEGEVNNRSVLTKTIEITNNFANGETESETIYLKTEGEPNKIKFIDSSITTDNNFENGHSNDGHSDNAASDNDIESENPTEVNQSKQAESNVEVITVINSKDDDENSSQFTCNQCGKTFRLKSGLKTHLIKHGTKLQCEVCGQEFNMMKDFKAHLRTHPDYRPYKCKICGKTFSTSTSLVKHMRTHGGEKKHLCTICGKRFYEQNHLTSFISKCALASHYRTHTGEKKYQCALCGKRAGRAADLQIHMRSHTGNL